RNGPPARRPARQAGPALRGVKNPRRGLWLSFESRLGASPGSAYRTSGHANPARCHVALALMKHGVRALNLTELAGVPLLWGVGLLVVSGSGRRESGSIVPFGTMLPLRRAPMPRGIGLRQPAPGTPGRRSSGC